MNESPPNPYNSLSKGMYYSDYREGVSSSQNYFSLTSLWQKFTVFYEIMNRIRSEHLL